MFCSKEVSHVLDCECHTTISSTIFNHTDLYSMYLVMRRLPSDIFGGFLARLRRVTIEPTHLYICIAHWNPWMLTQPRLIVSRCCASIVSTIYVGCINDSILPHDGLFKRTGHGTFGSINLEELMLNCYDSNNNKVQVPGLLTYCS